jgi:hypothetical protein
MKSKFIDLTKKLNTKHNRKLLGYMLITMGVTSFISEAALAADDADAFAKILTKANVWVSGSVGKLITFASLTMAGIMGIAGFPAKQVAGTVGVGLLLSSASGIVDMLF